MKSNYSWHIVSSPAQVPPLIKNVLEILRGIFDGMTPEERGDIKLILNELVFNAVLHGNLGNENKFVHVALSAREKMLSVSITDEGSGFNPEEIKSKLAGDECLRMENGRGIVLAFALADEINYSNEGRTVTFKKYIGLINPAAGD